MVSQLMDMGNLLMVCLIAIICRRTLNLDLCGIILQTQCQIMVLTVNKHLERRSLYQSQHLRQHSHKK